MYIKPSAFLTVILLTIIFYACQQNNNTDNKKDTQETSNIHPMDDSSRIIIDRSIAYAGGYEAWQQKKSLSFDKKSIYYDSTGKVTRESDMHL
ncbi:MAG TPA: hypothetical protein VM368_07730, partial [Flavisolibacter sp.]|nr:hypothetical protein [Flavisolibacter sp.]